MSTADAKLPTAPRLDGPPPLVLIVRAPYYREVVDGLTAGAERILRDVSARVEQVDVAGAYELPQAVELAARGPLRPDGYIVLGCVVRGETDHYEFICQAVMGGLLSVSLRRGLAMGTGLLTVDTIAQAEARSRLDGHNKGAEAAAAALIQIGVSRKLGPLALPPGDEDLHSR
jgi:6,7-dimethyl-8-ribityllumazine synthase